MSRGLKTKISAIITIAKNGCDCNKEEEYFNLSRVLKA